VHVGIAHVCPVDEFDAEFERRIGGPHHLLLVQSDFLVEIANGGNRRFADADGTDVFRLDQSNAAALSLRPMLPRSF
jgi:hypothetical protein